MTDNVIPLTPLDPFDEFYAAYPRKRSREDAIKAYAKMRRKVSHDRIMQGVFRMVAGLPNPLTKEDKVYLPYPATWLRAGGYDDPPDEDDEYRVDESQLRPPTDEEAEVHRLAFGFKPKRVDIDNPVSDFIKTKARGNGWTG